MQAVHLNTPPATPPTTSTITNAQLNLSVLQRHNTSIIHVLSIAPYSVIYTFSATAQTWEKSGIEGTLFVCQLRSNQQDEQEERYSVFVLNRRGLDNFELELISGEAVEVTDEYVILQSQELGVIYGVWIFAEPPPSSTAEMRSINAKVIQDCAIRAEASRNTMAKERNTSHAQKGPSSVREQDLEFANNQVFQGMKQQQQSPQWQQQAQRNIWGNANYTTTTSMPASGADMARQLSLRELFGQTRHDDENKPDNANASLANTSYHLPTQLNQPMQRQQQNQQPPQQYYNHPQQYSSNFPFSPSHPQSQYDSAYYHSQQPQFYPPQQQHPQPQPPLQRDVLSDLFQRARDGYGFVQQ